MNENRYLLDAVVLLEMTPSQRRAEFVRTYCRIPSEILYEAASLPDIHLFRELEVGVTTNILKNLKTVMATVEPGDRIIELYKNKGNGDMMLLACALTLMSGERPNLFPDRWIIVSDDKALRSKATELNVPSCSRAELVAFIEEAP